ncbi:MAG TPA: MotA/TolQ/ExbB proton channel family protein [Gemmataceae bacterium]|nr:MotA/TolQ/ExbB proton channel family protein [Gemmataceae bacterium]
MKSANATSADHVRRPSANLAALFVGVPLALLLLGLIHYGPLRGTPLHRYFEHKVEWVELLLFCCAVSVLGAKWVQNLIERRAFQAGALPPWDGRAVAVGEAPGLLAGLQRVPARLRNTFFVQRVKAILEFLCQRHSAAELDDQMRALLDSDSVVLEGSYALTRFITWAIPILGFLGTVLGITDAISGATPEVLEKNMSQVTDGLSYAFDATALALSLTMITMFCSFLVERQEQDILESVDREVERQLGHRFQRIAGDSGPFVEALRQNTQVLLDATGQLVERQADVWAKALTENQRRTSESSARQQEQMAGALETALKATLTTHSQMLGALEKQSLEQGTRLFEQLGALASVVRQYGHDQQAALVRVGESLAAQVAALGGLQQGEHHLLQLQAGLQQNLAALAGAGTFDQAVHSLTAAIHLLTARAGALPQVAAPPHPRIQPGKAA